MHPTLGVYSNFTTNMQEQGYQRDQMEVLMRGEGAGVVSANVELDNCEDIIC